MSNFDALRAVRKGELYEVKKDTRLKDAAMIGGGVLAYGGMLGIGILTMVVQAALVLMVFGVAVGNFVKGDILWGCVYLFIGVPFAAAIASWAAPWLVILGMIALAIWGVGAVFGVALNPFAIWGGLWSLLGSLLWLVVLFSIGVWIFGWIKGKVCR